MNRVGFSIFFVLFFSFIAFPDFSEAAAPPFQTLFVDTRLLLVSHPLFQTFDSETRRFRNSFSDPTLIRQIGITGVESRIQELEKALNALNAESLKKLSLVKGSLKKEMEQRFLAKKREIETQISILRGQKFFVKDMPGIIPFSEPRALIPEVFTISNDLKETLRRLKAKYQATQVIDVAGLLPVGPQIIDSKTLLGNQKNFHKSGKGALSNKKEICDWLLEAKKYWFNRDTDPMIIPVGGKDCRSESMEILESFVRGKK